MTSPLGQLANNQLLDTYEAMLAFHFGNVATSTIEKLSPKSLKEFDVKAIKTISKELGLEVHHKKLPLGQIQKHMLPCIAISKSGMSIMLVEIDEKTATIKRGKDEEREVVSLSFVKKYDKFVFITKSDKETDVLKVGDENDKSWFYTPLKKEWRSYIEVGVLTLFINIFGLALPLFTMNVYNRVIPNFATETLFVLAFGVGIILLFDVILKSSRVKIMERVSKKLSNHFEEELFKKTLGIQSQHDQYLVGTKTNLFRELSFVKDFFASKGYLSS